jgi:methylated-DNA-[protein]-cysteine S-methyltransferase
MVKKPQLNSGVIGMPFVIEWVDDCVGSSTITPISTPAGILAVSAINDVVIAIDWSLDKDDYQAKFLRAASNFHGKIADYWLHKNNPIPVKLLKQGSDYRQKVWAEMSKIPFGETLTYSGLAQKIGSSARAVGNACRDNPYPFIIPCHRVVSVTGIGGYCGQTDGEFMAIKRKLLAFEKANKP